MSTVHLAGFVVSQKNRAGGGNRVIVGCYQHGLPHRSELRYELPLDNSLIVGNPSLIPIMEELPVIQEPTILRLGHPRCVYAERGCSLAALAQN
jgi:hypothetical protein